MTPDKLKSWLSDISVYWCEIPIPSYHADKFVFGVEIDYESAVINTSHQQGFTIYIGRDGDLHIKAGGDWDYNWTLKGDSKHSYDFLKFLIKGSPP